MGWWSPALRTKARSWSFVALDATQVPDALAREPLEPERSYASGFLRSMWITDVRKGVTRFYGTVQSHVSLPHLSGGLAEFQVVAAPPDLRDVDRGDANRFVTRNIRLFGPVPYRGGDLDLELGLFSVAAGDLVAPYVELLETVAGAAGLSLVAAARPFVEPVKRGLDLLLGADGDATLEIGIAATFTRPESGYLVVLRKDASEVDSNALTISEDYRLSYDGTLVVDAPYAVVAIEGSSRREDWFRIPEVATAYAALRDDVGRGRLENVRESLAVFKRATMTSPDLLFEDAARLVETVGAEVDRTIRLTQTAGERETIPALAELTLYA